MLPPIGSPGYHLLLGAVAMFVLGPLGGISAAFMNFSIGFFVGGQVLAGILGSVVTLSYGPEGKHGANYIQTLSASVAGMCGMGVLLQAMLWLGLPEPPVWQLVLYYLCIGMFGVGVGMLYTPILVDRMRLMYPSGFAVANILRALTDPTLLRRSVARLGGGMLAGFVGGLAVSRFAWLGRLELSTSTFGAGMIVGARIALPAIVVAVIGDRLKPYLIEIGWLETGAPFRKIGFIIALGTILGAALVDIALILHQAWRRWREPVAIRPQPPEDWKRVNMFGLTLWVLFWGAAIVVVGSEVLRQPLAFLVVAVLLCFVFVLVNGISLGISDSNPISSAFVLTVFILAAMGLTDAGVGLLCASVLLIACTVGGDMQQDRSTGWRLGTHRVVQFRYQVAGILMGAVLAVVLAKTFMNAYPVLKLDQFSQSVPGAERWQSAMTYKFVGALRDITNPKPHVMRALQLGVTLGVLIEIARKVLWRNRRYLEFAKGSRRGRVTDFVLDAIVLPSPYASSFGGFVELRTCLWWSAGGVLASVYNWLQARWLARRTAATNNALPPDMSTTSLVGGGLIAGDSLAALSIGIYGLLRTVL
ncbi:MAG: OPT/YSL family transporter [Verrucomicrobiae bacterium]|nr:OPT/YSL family transporter [Verrucomicrobiae bacterium]